MSFADLLAKRKQLDAEIRAATPNFDRELLARYVPGSNRHRPGGLRVLAEEFGCHTTTIRRRICREEARITKALRQLEQTGKPDEALRDLWICYELGEDDVAVKL